MGMKLIKRDARSTSHCAYGTPHDRAYDVMTRSNVRFFVIDHAMVQSSPSSSRSSASSPQFWSIEDLAELRPSAGCQTRSLQQLMLNDGCSIAAAMWPIDHSTASPSTVISNSMPKRCVSPKPTRKLHKELLPKASSNSDSRLAVLFSLKIFDQFSTAVQTCQAGPFLFRTVEIRQACHRRAVKTSSVPAVCRRNRGD